MKAFSKNVIKGIIICVLITLITIQITDATPQISKYSPITFLKICFVKSNGSHECTWRFVDLNENNLTIALPQGVKLVKISLASISPFYIKDIIDEIGMSILHSKYYEGRVSSFLKYAYINLTGLNLKHIKVIIGKGFPLPLIFGMKISSSSKQNKFVLKGNSKTICKVNSLGAIVNIASFPEGRVSLQAPFYFLVKENSTYVTIPGIGNEIVNVKTYIVYGSNFTIINNDNKEAIVLLNFTEIRIVPMNYNVKSNCIEINLFDKSWYVIFSLPDFVNVTSINGGIILKRDFILHKLIPENYFIIKPLSNIIHLNLEIAPISFTLSNQFNSKIPNTLLKITLPNGISILQYGAVRLIQLPPPYYFLLDVIIDGVRVISYNVTNIPKYADIKIKLGVLRVYVLSYDGKPIPNATVSIYSFTTYSYQKTLTNNEGIATFENLILNHNYSLIIVYHNVEVYRSVIVLNKLNEIKYLTTRVGRVNLLVKDQRGRVLNGVNVTLFLKPNIIVHNKVKEGIVNLGLLPFAKYRVQVTYKGLTLYRGFINIDSPGTYNICINDYKITLLLKDLLGAPLTGIKVELIINGTIFEGISDDSGFVQFDFLPKGIYTLKIVMGSHEIIRKVNIDSDRYLEIKVPYVLMFGILVSEALFFLIITIMITAFCGIVFLKVKGRREVVVIK